MELSNGFYWEGTSSGGCKLRRGLEPISFGHINNHLRDKWTVFVWGGRTEEERLGAGGDFEQVFDTLEEAKAFLYTTARLEGHDD